MGVLKVSSILSVANGCARPDKKKDRHRETGGDGDDVLHRRLHDSVCLAESLNEGLLSGKACQNRLGRRDSLFFRQGLGPLLALALALRGWGVGG